jgi:hypothetical protein
MVRLGLVGRRTQGKIGADLLLKPRFDLLNGGRGVIHFKNQFIKTVIVKLNNDRPFRIVRKRRACYPCSTPSQIDALTTSYIPAALSFKHPLA